MPGLLRISAAEQLRADECAREPIHTPGAIQPHGAFLAVDAVTWLIVSASENVGEFFGLDADTLLGQPLSDVTGAGPLAHFIEVLDPTSLAANPALIAINGRSFDVILNRTGGVILLDFEPTMIAIEAEATATIFAAIRRLAVFTTAVQLWSEAARELSLITRFDRVMIYHFHPDGHGEIVAEQAAKGMEPYLGLHYPASDIPAQARELYLLKLSRVIADSGAEAVVLSRPAAAPVLDLSLAELRSVSPHHLQFMRNMGQASTMSFSLVHDGVLIGMITCAHQTPKRVSYVVRQALEILASQVALQLSSISSLEQLSRQLELRDIRTRVVDSLMGDVGLTHGLLRGSSTMFDLIAADGATVRLNGVSESFGSAPTASAQLLLTDLLDSRGAGLAFVTESVALDHPELVEIVPGVTGVLIVAVGIEGDYIAWFRSEQLHSVSWLGDLSPSNRVTPLSPRSSFTAWSRDVTGVSRSWRDVEGEAAELGRDLEQVLFRRSESELAHVALFDPLTGLSNRRRLMDRLEHALTKYARGEELALLFVDLDGFKAVNDALGHDVGDSLLIRTAEQLLATVREQDTVARLGGDEFVVICENTDALQAEVLAQRLLTAIRSTVPGATVHDEPFTISASIGIASADLAFGATDLLRQADGAMYRAKVAGRDQFSR